MPVASAPADAGEMFRQYYPYVKTLARRYGVPAQEVDDVASTIMAALVERDVLGMFDPGKRIVYDGVEYRAKFRTFLVAQVLLYLRGQRDKLGRKAQHEVLICDRPVDAAGMTRWIDVHGGSAEDDYSSLAADEIAAEARAYLSTVPPRTPQDRCDLVAVFNEMVRQGRWSGTISAAEAAKVLGVTPTTAGNWIRRVKSYLKYRPAFPAEPAFIVGGIRLTPELAKEAARVLEAAPGIMVAQPLQRAGHVLARAERGWYHKVAAEELAEFPALAVGSGTRSRPAGHVKIAVVHYLRRIADGCAPEPAESQPDEQPEPETPEERLTAAIWHQVPELTGDQIDRILAAVHEFAGAA
jgi:hypothetical protein